LKSFALACALAFTVVSGVPAPASAAAQSAWPRTLTQGGVTIVAYQPQVESWPNYTVLHALSAVGVTQSGSQTPIYGVVRFDSYTTANFQTGEVQLVDSRITSTNWPGQSAAAAAKLDAAIRSVVQFQDRTIPLATVLASLDAKSAQGKPLPLGTAPPTIFQSERKSMLVVFDGQPLFAPIEGTSLKLAGNTNWAVIQDGATYYLLATDSWLSAASVNGPWSPATAPASFAAIPNNDNWTEVHAHLGSPALPASQIPIVFTSTQPADLLAFSGSPKFATIPGTSLKYVTNTDSDVFFYTPTTLWYVLLSGRWYRAANLSGPWTYASTTLPADFKKIPVNSPRGRVLVSVPGTPESDYAGASTRVPQIATVDPKTTSVSVTYGPGEPQFKPIAGTSLYYAVNTPYDVIKVSDTLYYTCYSGVWFSAATPAGPWSVAYYVPQAIYTIPVSSPLYPDTFVYIYNPDGTIRTSPPPPAPTPTPYNNYAADAAAAGLLIGFTAGYLGSYWGWGGYWYGTGWYYPGWYGGGAYYPYAATWTGGAYYNSANGAYGRYGSVYGPYGGATAHAQYNPSTGTYSRGASVYGPNGSAKAGSFYNPRYGVAGHGSAGSSPYGSWAHGTVTSRYGSADAGRVSGANGTAAGVATRNGTTGVAKGSNGDVYAGHDGNVYRNQNGQWQKSDGSGSWSNVNKPSTSSAASYQRPSGSSDNSFSHAGSSGSQSFHPDFDSMNRDFNARQAGSSGFRGFSGGGGFRGGGGGFRR
jgi:hypothetical protein